jgi:ubiquinone/menaquinone biosynthesis C-methylase UbiE
MSSSFVAPVAAADSYDAFMGRWSRRLAPLFLDFAGVSDDEQVIDIGCGTGSLTFEIPSRANIASIEAIDYEPQFVEAARRRNKDPRINIQTGDACNLQFADGQFDRALSLLVLHFVAEPKRAVAEMRRVVRPGGVAAATVWDNYGGQPSIRLFWDIAATLDARAIERRNAALIRPMTQAGELAAAFSEAGFADVAETTISIRMEFMNYDDYRTPMAKGQGVLANLLETAAPSTREQIDAALRASYLCGRPDGPRSFVSVAWAVRATVPPT